MDRASELPEGAVVGKWRVLKLLGRGGQGVVWGARATDTKRGPERALKACFSTDPKDRARFEREIHLLKQCASPYVLAILDAGSNWASHVEGQPPFAYYVAEKCAGSLKDLQATLGDVRERIRLAVHACRCVSHLHGLAEPVIHRDIKPANFLIALEPRRLVLADFGIAREAVSESALTATQEVVGSRFFRAPEILSGSPGNALSDVYSLGRLLEWLLTGDVSGDLGTRPVPRGLDLADDACDALDRIIAKATQAIPGYRFASVDELANAIPEFWWSIRPRPVPSEATIAVGPNEVVSTALELARTENWIGWRQLEQRLRRDLSHVR